MNPQSYDPEPIADESREAPLPERPDPGQPVPEQPVPEQSVPEQPVPEQPVPEQPVPEQPVPGQPVPAGAAPDNRQCRYTLASGRHCRRWAVRAHDFCHEHARWMDTRVDGAIEVPLLEDPAAIALTLSQTARQLGWGRIPPPNARGIIAACRASQINLGHSLAIAKFQLAQAKFRLKLHQLKLTEHDLPPLPPTGSGSGADPTPSSGAHPLDDTLPPPQPLSACDPCIEAIMKGADESKLDCKHCPGYLAGNLRAPQLPDARNPPESPRPLAPPEPPLDLSAMDLGPTNQPALIATQRIRTQRIRTCAKRVRLDGESLSGQSPTSSTSRSSGITRSSRRQNRRQWTRLPLGHQCGTRHSLRRRSPRTSNRAPAAHSLSPASAHARHQLKTENWQLTTDHWRLATGNWQLGTDNW